MERLTGRNEAGDLLLCGRTVYGNDEDVYNAVSLLDEYEDTDFDPSGIADIKAEVERLTSDLNATVKCHESWLKSASDRLNKVNAENDTLRNELCLKCGRYKTAHEGSCEGCRWKR